MNEQMNNGVQPQEIPPVPETNPAPEGNNPPKSGRPSQPKKELTPAEIQKRKKMLVMPLFFLIFGGVMWLIFAPSGKDQDESAGQSGFNAELPVPKDEGIVGDKRTAYEQEAQRQREQDKVRSMQDLSDMFGQTEEQKQEEYERQLRMAPKPPEYYENPELFEGGGSQRAGNSAIQSSATAYHDINRQLGAWYEQSATETDEQAQLAVESRIEELERRLAEVDAQKATEDEQTALLEKSYQMAARYMPQSATGIAMDGTGETAAGSSAKQTGQSGKAVAQPVRQVRHNVVSLLSAPMSDDEFIESFSRPRNMGFFTATGNENAADKNTIRACVYQTVTLTSGKELQIRLLEPMRAGDVLIPANSVITGSCRVGGERMEVAVNSIQYAGNIIPVELSVYDMHGQHGIFIPGSDEINAAKEVASTMASSAGTSIMISDNAGSQLAADMGKGLIQGASQYVSKKMSVVKVTLKANYQLLLLPKTQ